MKQHFDLLNELLANLSLHDKPTHINNMDEIGLPLNNRPPRVLADKATKEVLTLTSAERGENITVIACCNAAGSYIHHRLLSSGVKD